MTQGKARRSWSIRRVNRIMFSVSGGGLCLTWQRLLEARRGPERAVSAALFTTLGVVFGGVMQPMVADLHIRGALVLSFALACARFCLSERTRSFAIERKLERSLH